MPTCVLQKKKCKEIICCKNQILTRYIPRDSTAKLENQQQKNAKKPKRGKEIIFAVHTVLIISSPMQPHLRHYPFNPYALLVVSISPRHLDPFGFGR